MPGSNPIVRVLSPNLGKPALVANDADGLHFEAFVVSDSSGVDVCAVLNGRLFLQELEDTQEIVQKAASSARMRQGNYPNVLTMAGWPTAIRDRLIPLELVSCLPAEKLDAPISFRSMSGMKGLKYSVTCEDGYCLVPADEQTCAYGYVATLRFAAALVRSPMRRLFNLVQAPDGGIEDSGAGPCTINYHAVYIHHQQWRTFSFLHITDMHVAWRCDFMEEVIRSRLGEWGSHPPEEGEAGKLARRYHNFNRQFRSFIDYANRLHRQGLIDFILLTGDIVDFVYIETRFDPGQPDAPGVEPLDNYELFLQLVTGWPTCDRVPTSSELEVPIFTCPGNHDYRDREYAIAGKVNFDLVVGEVTIKPVTEYRKFGLSEEEARAYVAATMGTIDFSTRDAGNWVYPRHSPSASYFGLLTPEINYCVALGKHRILCVDTGYDAGAISGALDWLWAQISGESESESHFLAGDPDSVGFTDKSISLIAGNVAGPHDGLVVLACHAPVLNYKDGAFLDRFDYNGPRNPILSYSATANSFDKFVDLVFGGHDHVKHIDLILSGHTHNHREFEFGQSTGKLNAVLNYPVRGGVFTDLLADASDKAGWWAQQRVESSGAPSALLIQTPWLNSSANPSRYQTFDMLRVVVDSDVIVGIEKLSIGDTPRLGCMAAVMASVGLLLDAGPDIEASVGLLLDAGPDIEASVGLLLDAEPDIEAERESVRPP